MSVKAQESRVDALTRILGLIVLFSGATLVYFTYANASYLSGQEPLVPVYYSLGIILLISGLIAAISKFK
ncbi:MAG TPA: hypothetical protein VEJ36_08670 [Nitrososphaerales archaeon]|nr:hypothetical protein [Nitrososphaerales archaeon]